MASSDPKFLNIIITTVNIFYQNHIYNRYLIISYSTILIAFFLKINVWSPFHPISDFQICACRCGNIILVCIGVISSGMYGEEKKYLTRAADDGRWTASADSRIRGGREGRPQNYIMRMAAIDLRTVLVVVYVYIYIYKYITIYIYIQVGYTTRSSGLPPTRRWALLKISTVYTCTSKQNGHFSALSSLAIKIYLSGENAT